MCFLTEQEVKRDGEDEFKIWNVTDKKNVYILKTGQPGVGMAFKWKVVEFHVRGSEERPDIQGKLHPSNGKKRSHHRLPSRWGDRDLKVFSHKGVPRDRGNCQEKNYPERRVEGEGLDFVQKAWKKLGEKVAPSTMFSRGRMGQAKNLYD